MYHYGPIMCKNIESEIKHWIELNNKAQARCCWNIKVHKNSDHGRANSPMGGQCGRGLWKEEGFWGAVSSVFRVRLKTALLLIWGELHRVRGLIYSVVPALLDECRSWGVSETGGGSWIWIHLDLVEEVRRSASIVAAQPSMLAHPYFIMFWNQWVKTIGGS